MTGKYEVIRRGPIKGLTEGDIDVLMERLQDLHVVDPFVGFAASSKPGWGELEITILVKANDDQEALRLGHEIIERALAEMAGTPIGEERAELIPA